MKEQKAKMNELKYATIPHKGKWHQSEKVSPLLSEEHAHTDAVSLILTSVDRSMINND